MTRSTKAPSCAITGQDGKRCAEPRLHGQPICELHEAMLDQPGLWDYEWAMRRALANVNGRTQQLTERRLAQAIAVAQASVTRSLAEGVSLEVTRECIARRHARQAEARKAATSPTPTRGRKVGARANSRAALRGRAA